MIMLAAIEGNLIFLIVAAAAGVINWWLEKKKKESKSATPEPPPEPTDSATPDAARGSEEQERLRRFLEALGVPQGQQQPPPPQPKPQTPRPQPVQPPRPRPVPQPRERRMQTPKPVAKPVTRVDLPAKRPVIQYPEEFAEAGRLEEPASAIERISGEFRAMNARVAVPAVHHGEGPAPREPQNAGTTSVLEREGNPLVASLRRTLTNPTDIRSAILAAELLGPPRGLQK